MNYRVGAGRCLFVSAFLRVYVSACLYVCVCVSCGCPAREVVHYGQLLGGAYHNVNLLHRLCRKECVSTEPMPLCCVFELLWLPCLCCVIAATSCCLVVVRSAVTTAYADCLQKRK